jgi:hypothetical protein
MFITFCQVRFAQTSLLLFAVSQNHDTLTWA